MRLSLGGRRKSKEREIRALERQALALRTEDPDKALALFHSVLDRNPGSVVALRASGRLLLKARRYEDAKPMWERLASQLPDDPEPHVQLGRIYRRWGRREDAQSEADKAVALAPHYAAAQDLQLRMASAPNGAAPQPQQRSRQGLWRRLWPFGRAVQPPSAPLPAAALAVSPDALMARARAFVRDGNALGFVRTLETLLVSVGPSRNIVDLAVQNRILIRRAASRRLQTLVDLAFAVQRDDGVNEAEAELARRAKLRAAKADPALTLIADARAQVADGDVAGFLKSVRTALAVDGPTPPLLDLVQEHTAVVHRTGDLRLLALIESGKVDERAAGVEEVAAELARRAELRAGKTTPGPTLIADARTQAQDGNVAGFLRTIRTALALDGPTLALMSVMNEHASVIRRAGDPRLLALLDFDSARGTPRPESRLADDARACVREGDISGFLRALEVALAEEGPTPSLTSLAREHEGIVRRLGDRRLQALLVVDPSLRTVRAAATDPRIAECVSSVQSALADGDVRAAAKTLEELAALAASDRSAREALGAQAEPLLLALKSRREAMHPRTLAALERRLKKIFADEPWVIQAVARQRELEGNLVAALNFYGELSDRAPGAAPALLHAATLAVGLGREAEAWEFARRASAAAPDDRRMATALSDLFVRHGRTERAIEFWRETDQAGSLRLWARLGLVRTLELAGDRGGVLSETIRTVREAPLLSDMAAPDLNMLVDIVRHLVQSQSRAPNLAGLDELASLLLQKEPPSPLRAWMLANVDLARPDLERALAQFDEGIDLGPPPDGIPLDHHAEKALALQRYHRFGDAYAAWETADQEKVKANGHYARRREFLRQVVELCAGDPRRLLYPECLFDILFEEIARSPPKREGHAGHVVMVSGSLGQGGGERQTITVVRRMIGEGRLEKLSLLVRSTHMRDHDDFFLSRVAELPVDLTIYGADWQRRSNIAELLPEFADRPKIVAAIDLMPTNSREEVARLCRQLFDRRPQAVHVWQDIPYAAVACALVGIRHFFVHRGSLAPDYWAQSDYQTATHFRPMRHIYRRLLERSDFVLLNNSVSGCETDQKWLGWPSAEPFQVVYNAVDFSQLGEHVGRNLALRRELGIPDDAPVIGGSFRIVAVKRPLYWIEAARQIREAVPNAHFLIIGDGDMTEEVAAFAFEHGFGEALHLPGRVANVGDWYRAMDLKLMTSEREGIPNAIIEAQHFGVPIVATHVGGIHEAIDPGQTGHVTPGDNGPEPYAAQVIASLRDSAWHEAAREKAPRFVHDKFSLDTVVERLMHYYGMNAAGIPAPGMIDGLSGSDVAGARR